MGERDAKVKEATELKIALIMVSILLVTSLVANLYLYTRQHGVIGDSGLENQIVELQNEIKNLKAAKLIKVKLIGTDTRPWLQTPYLQVTGEVVNVGTRSAYKSKLHVILYQGQVVAKDTAINLGTIEGEGWQAVDSKIYYEGSALTAYSITPEWQ